MPCQARQRRHGNVASRADREAPEADPAPQVTVALAVPPSVLLPIVQAQEAWPALLVVSVPSQDAVLRRPEGSNDLAVRDDRGVGGAVYRS